MPAAFPIEPVYTMARQPPDLPADCRFPVENRESLGHIQELLSGRLFGKTRNIIAQLSFHKTDVHLSKRLGILNEVLKISSS
ncbi:hypothetical protein D915_007113 [Fasciola hepatica]|uniref:Uncharacterized protein n=1 Tax=Fasciola hepatica TaxID=6192 RepID=A0A4E0R600_FASHE|nr:hypothetical protein D915_007113 [Fasciola hepatica]